MFQHKQIWISWCCSAPCFALLTRAHQRKLDVLETRIANARTPPLAAAERESPWRSCTWAISNNASFNVMWVEIIPADDEGQMKTFPHFQLFHSFGSCDYLIYHRGNAPHQNCLLFGPKHFSYQVRSWAKNARWTKYSEYFQTMRKLSRLSGNFSDCQE